LPYAGHIFLTPPPNVARGASSGGRLGGRPYCHLSMHNLASKNFYRHHQFAVPPDSKNFGYKKPPNASVVKPEKRPDR
jgi:hypothetical protein